MKRTSRFLIFIFAALAAFSAVWAGAQRIDSDGTRRDRDRLKAAYIYIEAANAYADERFDDYYMLLRRAAALDPDDPFIAGEIAEMDMISPLTDSIRGEKAYADIRRRFLAAPADLQIADSYIKAASNIGNVDDLLEAWTILDSLRPDRADVSLNLAQVLVIKSLRGDSAAYPRALAIYDRLLDAIPGDIGITSQKIRAFSAWRDTASIRHEISRLVATAPDNVNINLYAGDTYAALAIPDSARKYLDRALELEPESGRVFIARARFFENSGDKEEFDREIFNALQASDLEFDPKFEILAHYVSGLFSDPANRPRIDAMFARLLELNPGEPRLHALYGAYEESQNNNDSAIEQYSYSLDLDPMQSDIWMAYLRLLSIEERVAPALEGARRAMKLFPDEITYPLAAAGNLLFQQKKEEALALLDSVSPAALTDPIKASRLHGFRGDLFEAVGRRDSAYAEYDRAIRLNPRNSMAMNNMAYFMALDSINLDLAKTYASMAVSDEPENPTYLDTYAWVEFRRRDFPEAKRLIDLAMQAYLIPADSVVQEVWIDTAWSEQDSALVVPEEEVVVDEVNEVLEPSGEIFDHAGDIYFWNGLHKEAAEFWEKAAILLPEDEKIRKKAKFKTYFFE